MRATSVASCALSLVVFVSASTATLMAAETMRKARIEHAVACDRAGWAWEGPGEEIVVDRRRTKRTAKNTTFRLDDELGYWTFPASHADVVVLVGPDNPRSPLNVSIAQETTSAGVVKTCSPEVNEVGRSRPPDLPALEDPSVEHLLATAHVVDPVACARPFQSSNVAHLSTRAFRPSASIQRIAGVVSVGVSLDPNGAIVSAEVVRSPSPVLNDIALWAAKAATYNPEIFRCRPVSSSYDFDVEFGRRP